MKFLIVVPLVLSIVSGYKLEPKIIDGKKSIAKPWMVALRHPQFSCGGVMYTRSLILSAAHCAREKSSEWKAYVNRFDLRSIYDHEGSKENILRYVKHPKFVDDKPHFDISAWWVDSDSADRTEVVLDKGSEAKDMTRLATIMGWGKTERRSPEVLVTNIVGTDILLEAQVPLNNDEKCIERYPQTYDPEMMICTGYSESGAGSCQGDSGGPVFRTKGTQIILIGIISHGEGCGYQNFYSLDVKVSNPHVAKFIKKYEELFNPENLVNLNVENPSQIKDTIGKETVPSKPTTQSVPPVVVSPAAILSRPVQKPVVLPSSPENKPEIISSPPIYSINHYIPREDKSYKDFNGMQEEIIREPFSTKSTNQGASTHVQRSSYSESTQTDSNGNIFKSINGGPWQQVGGTSAEISNLQVPSNNYSPNREPNNHFQLQSQIQPFSSPDFQFQQPYNSPLSTGNGFTFAENQPMAGYSGSFRSSSSSGSRSISRYSSSSRSHSSSSSHSTSDFSSPVFGSPFISDFSYPPSDPPSTYGFSTAPFGARFNPDFSSPSFGTHSMSSFSPPSFGSPFNTDFSNPSFGIQSMSGRSSRNFFS